MVAMSTIAFPLTEGCWTLTATTLPSFNFALCTWASEAVPTGSGENSVNNSRG